MGFINGDPHKIIMASRLGLTTTLWIIIGAVIVVVVALVLLTIFGRGMLGITSLADFRKNCEVTGRASCQTVSYLPLTWEVNTPIDNKPASCATEWSCTSCDTCNWPTPSLISGEVPPA